MAKVDGDYKLSPGAYMTIKIKDGLKVEAHLNIKWYGWPFLLWKTIHEEYEIKWYEYPKVIFLIICFTVDEWIQNHK